MNVVVIGAGLSGLMAAQSLQAQGHKVLVVDKGRSPGGRLATRRIGTATLDHGAQFFTVRSEEFAKHVDAWLQQGVKECKKDDDSESSRASSLARPPEVPRVPPKLRALSLVWASKDAPLFLCPSMDQWAIRAIRAILNLDLKAAGPQQKLPCGSHGPRLRPSKKPDLT